MPNRLDREEKTNDPDQCALAPSNVSHIIDHQVRKRDIVARSTPNVRANRRLRLARLPTCYRFRPLVGIQLRLATEPNRGRTCACNAASVLALISDRSNSARPPRTVSISLPAGVVVSIHGSASDRNAAPPLAIVLRTLSKSRVLQARRSRRAEARLRRSSSRAE